MEDLKKEIPETMDVIVFIFAIAGLIKEELQDGFQGSDVVNILVKFFSDSEFQGKMAVAIDGIMKIPGEFMGIFTSLKFAVIMELGKFIWFEGKKLFTKNIMLEP